MESVPPSGPQGRAGRGAGAGLAGVGNAGAAQGGASGRCDVDLAGGAGRGVWPLLLLLPFGLSLRAPPPYLGPPPLFIYFVSGGAVILAPSLVLRWSLGGPGRARGDSPTGARAHTRTHT